MHFVIAAVKYDLVFCWLFCAMWLFIASFAARRDEPSRKHYHWAVSFLVSFAWPLFFLLLIATGRLERVWRIVDRINDFFERAYCTYSEANS